MGSLNLDRANFNTDDADAVAASANVGAFVRASDGTLITKTTVSSKEGLDVNLINASIAVTADDLDIRDLDATSDSVSSWVKDGSGTAITSTTVGAAQGLDVNILNDISVDMDGVYDSGNNPNPDNVGMIVHARAAAPADSDQTKRTTGAEASSDAVVAANVHGLDVNSFLMGYNGTTWDRLRTRNNDLKTADVCDTAFTAPTEVSVDDTAGGVQLVASALANRKTIFIQNNGKYPIRVGANGVTATKGLLVGVGGNINLPAGPSQDFYAICTIAGKSCPVGIMELS